MANEVIGTSDMPEPQILSYSTNFRATPVFLNDLKIVLGEMAYADVKKITDVLESHNNVLPNAVLNEFIRTLSMLPYKYVHRLMAVLGQKDKFTKYFEELDEDGNSIKKDTVSESQK